MGTVLKDMLGCGTFCWCSVMFSERPLRENLGQDPSALTGRMICIIKGRLPSSGSDALGITSASKLSGSVAIRLPDPSSSAMVKMLYFSATVVL